MKKVKGDIVKERDGMKGKEKNWFSLTEPKSKSSSCFLILDFAPEAGASRSIIA
jgi:hypothetical protein